MIQFLLLPINLRRQIINQVNTRTAMSAKAVEKDWWVTLVLKALFSLPMSQHFIFKGGTSLSKGWKLIDRFSEDIDIAIAPEAFGTTYQPTPSHSYVKMLKRKGAAYTNTTIKEALEAALLTMGIPGDLFSIEVDKMTPELPDKDPQAIYLYYTSLYDKNEYITDRVKIEFGVRSLLEPFSKVPIQSIIAEEFPTPSYSEIPFTVTAVEPRKTFMEKLLLLHERFSAGKTISAIAERQSRHVSDLVQMMNKGVLQQVIDDKELYTAVLQHRKYYVRLKHLNYDQIHTTGLSIIPPVDIIEEYRKDYRTMLIEMIYGTPPDFDTLIAQLNELNNTINRHSKLIA